MTEFMSALCVATVLVLCCLVAKRFSFVDAERTITTIRLVSGGVIAAAVLGLLWSAAPSIFALFLNAYEATRSEPVFYCVTPLLCIMAGLLAVIAGKSYF